MNRHYLFGLALTALAFGGVVACNNEAPETDQNKAPVVEGISAETTSLDPGQQITLELNAYDPDNFESDAGLSATSSSSGGDAGMNGGGMMASHIVRWSVSDSDWTIEGNGLTATLTAPNAYERETSVTARIIDADNSRLSDSGTIDNLRTGQNQRPAIAGISASPSPVTPDGTVTLSATADDPVDELSYSWSVESDDNWSLVSNAGPEVNLLAPDSDDSVAQVTVTVSDDFGLSNSLQTSVRTTENRAPTISSISAGPPQVDPGGTSTLTVSASDADGNELTYDWSGPSNWSFDGTGSEVEVTAPNEFGVSASLSVTVTDSRGASTSAESVVSTISNGGPVISGISAQPSVVERGSTTTIEVTASHPNDSPLSYEWAVSNSNWQLSPAGSTAEVQAPNTPRAGSTVRVTVTDQTGRSIQTSTFVTTPPNRAPSINSFSASPPNVRPGLPIDVDAFVSDPDGDDMTFDWSVSSPWQINGGGSSIRLSSPDIYGSTATVELTVTDEFGLSARSRVTVATVQNFSPSVSSITANPSQLLPQDTSTVSVVANDPNDDQLTYNWSVSGNWSLSGSGNSVTVTAPNSYNETGLVEVVVSDGFGGSAEADVVVETKSNQAPVISSITANPAGAVEPGTTKGLSVTANDPDGSNSALQYDWSPPANWSFIGSSTVASPTLSAPSSHGVSGTVTIEVTDQGGATTTGAIVVATEQNDAPVFLDQLTVNPAQIGCSEQSTAEVRMYDPNGDSLTFNWTLSNSNDFNITENGDEATIEMASGASSGASTDVTVTVDDGATSVTSRTRTIDGPTIIGGCP